VVLLFYVEAMVEQGGTDSESDQVLIAGPSIQWKRTMGNHDTDLLERDMFGNSGGQQACLTVLY